MIWMLLTLLAWQAPTKPMPTKPVEPEVPPEYSLTDPLKMVSLAVAIAEKEGGVKENALARKKVVEELGRHVQSHRGERVMWPFKMELVTDKSITPQPTKYKGFTLELAAEDEKNKNKRVALLHKNAAWVSELKKGDYYYVGGEITKILLEGNKVVVILKRPQLVNAQKPKDP